MKTSFPRFFLTEEMGSCSSYVSFAFYFFERVHASHPLKEIVPFALVIHFSCLLRFETSFFIFFLEKCSTCHRPEKTSTISLESSHRRRLSSLIVILLCSMKKYADQSSALAHLLLHKVN